MLSQEQHQRVVAKTRMAQLVGAAMVLGAIFCGGCICLLANWENYGVLKLITLVGGLTGISIFVLSFIIPFVFPKIPASKDIKESSNVENRDDAVIDSIMQMIFTESITRGAIIEGAILLNMMVFMLEPHLIPLVVAGIGILLMLLLIPWPSRAVSKVEDRLREFRERENLST